jgi:hypothetical protein
MLSGLQPLHCRWLSTAAIFKMKSLSMKHYKKGTKSNSLETDGAVYDQNTAAKIDTTAWTFPLSFPT